MYQYVSMSFNIGRAYPLARVIVIPSIEEERERIQGLKYDDCF